MKINWIVPGVEIREGLEEGTMELEYYPGIRMDKIFRDVEPITNTDAEEREWLMNESNVIVDEIKKDLYTRKALFYNLHESELRINCINLFHFVVRSNDLRSLPNKNLNLYVYVRSMNVLNIGYDLVTIDKIYRHVRKKLNSVSAIDRYIDVGKVVIRIASLHDYKDEADN